MSDTNKDLPSIDWAKSALWPRPDLATRCGRWAMPGPRVLAHWNEQEDADLRAAWGKEPIEVIAERHGRECSHLKTRAIALGIEERPVKVKPEKAAPSKAEPVQTLKPVVRVKVEVPPLPPDLKILCDAGLTENCAQVILLAAAPHYLSKADIAQKLLLPSGLQSVSRYFQMAGLVWGIGGKGAHAAIVERACNLLQGRKV